MAPQESIDIVQCLEDSRAEFIAAAAELAELQAKTSPAPGRWSVLECVEHVVVAESRFSVWLQNPIPEPAPPMDKAKESTILSRVAGRATAVQAPEPVRPTGRFATLAEALAEFGTIRASTIRFAESQGAGLYTLAAKHPFLGVCNGAELMVLIAAHSRRHAAQIREIRESPSALGLG